MTHKTLKTNFEREILFQIIFKMKQKRMSTKKAKQIARVVLPIVKKSTTNEEFLNDLSKLCSFYPEILDVYLSFYKDYEKEFKNEKLKSVLKSLEEESGRTQFAASKGGEN
jgi:hypothetical protein